MGSDPGVEKTAVLLLALGEEQAAEVLKHLGPREVQKLGHAMAALKSVPRAQVEATLDEFQQVVRERAAIHVDSDAYLRNVLTKALGEEKAANLLPRLLHGSETSGIEGLKWLDAPTAADLVKNEHPQIIATILVHLERDHASEILAHCAARLRNDVILRIATLDGVEPVALQELNDVLTRLLAGAAQRKKKVMGGVRPVAEILNFMSTAHETAVISALQEHDPALAQQVLDEMFVFEDLRDLDDRSVQLILREIQSDSLILALKGASEALREKIYKNLSQRAATVLQEDLEAKGPVRLSEAEGAQKDILKLVRRLAEDGHLALKSKGDEQFV